MPKVELSTMTSYGVIGVEFTVVEGGLVAQ